MKAFMKNFALPSLFMVVLTTQVSAQNNRSSNTNDRTVKASGTTTKKSIVNGRVPSNTVTFKKTQKKIVSVRNVPNKTVVNYNGQKYYYANNKYYTQSSGRYIPIAPKVGFRIQTLPVNYKKVHFNNYNYFNSNGIFYIQINNEYEVVDPAVGTIVYELPADYEKVVIDGSTYYEYANILYEKVQVEGARAYEVVGIIDME